MEFETALVEGIKACQALENEGAPIQRITDLSNVNAHHQWNYTLVACFTCGLGAFA